MKIFNSITKQFKFTFCNTKPTFQQLTQQFIKLQDINVFSNLIKQSNQLAQNINYFKIYKFLQENKANTKQFQDYYFILQNTIPKKSDNIRMLLAKIKVRIAKRFQQSSNFIQACDHTQLALQILQESLVPPVLLYYQIYRYYGQLQYKKGDLQLAQQALKQSVDMIEHYLQHSQDAVSSNQNSKNQAKAYNTLAMIDEANRQKYILKSLQNWQDYQGNKYQLQQYADSVIIKSKLQYKKSKKQGEQFLMPHFYQFKSKQLKQKLQKVKLQFIQ